MQKIQAIDNRVELFLNLIENNTQHPSASYIGQALFCHNYCFEVVIEIDEFKRLLLNSHALDSTNHLQHHEFPTLQEVVNQIKNRPIFLQESRLDGGLSGNIVKKKLDNVGNSQFFKGSLIRDKESKMRQEGSFYISDGMHRLVAYGLLNDLNPEKFPIRTYLCTNHLV
jgi:hypothetical protein